MGVLSFKFLIKISDKKVKTILVKLADDEVIRYN